MQKPTPTGSKTTSAKTNGSARRRLTSWIARFVEVTSNLESPRIYRQWAAITAIGAALEQKVWLKTSSELYPNIYCFIVGHPGIGKTRTVRAIKSYFAELEGYHIAPTSMSGASMVDNLLKAKRNIIRLPDPQLEYNSMLICADELSAFMHQYDHEMVGMLTSFYDTDPYSQTRRTKDIDIKIASPQLNILCGTTPSNLVKLMPDFAWDQGLTSRIVMVFSDERMIEDDFAKHSVGLDNDLLHDLRSIAGLSGQFDVMPAYRDAVMQWRKLGQLPVPDHPKLVHYCTRRKVHLYKMSMISAVDRSDALILTRDDFDRALSWLIEAERFMPDIFKAAGGSAESKAMEEIYHFILTEQAISGRKEVSEQRINNFARERVPIHSILRVIEIMERSGMITHSRTDSRANVRYFRADVPSLDVDDA